MLIACLMMLSACAREPAAPKPPVGLDALGIAPKGGAAYSLMRDEAVFDQRDPAWGGLVIGASDNQTIADYGCTLTSVAMAAVNLGEETDPGRLHAALIQEKAFTPSGWLVWDGVSRATAGRVVVDWYDAPDAAAIDACLKDAGGYPVVKFMLKGRIQHWAVIVGKQGTQWLIRDPQLITQKPIPLETRAPSIRALRCVRPS